MGIEVQSVKLLLLARQLGVDFTDTLTIGRQDLLVDDAQVSGAFAHFGERLASAEARAMSGVENRFSTAIFKRLGAAQVDFMDVSDFEGATVLHDLNTPLPPELAGRFSLVFDGGTLEHVFDVPAALRSYTALPRVGGHLILAVPANNEMGHGFYQFSPELFFRTLTAARGYRIKGMFVAPIFVDADWHAVRDPAKIGARVGWNGSRRETYLLVIAERIGEGGDAATPLQSDYAAEWQAEDEKARHAHATSASTRLKRAIRSVIPGPLYEVAQQARAAARGPDPRGFLPFAPGKDDPTALADLYR